MLRDDVGFPTVYRRICRRKFLTLTSQTSRYIRKCIRIIDQLIDYPINCASLNCNTEIFQLTKRFSKFHYRDYIGFYTFGVSFPVSLSIMQFL